MHLTNDCDGTTGQSFFIYKNSLIFLQHFYIYMYIYIFIYTLYYLYGSCDIVCISIPCTSFIYSGDECRNHETRLCVLNYINILSLDRKIIRQHWLHGSFHMESATRFLCYCHVQYIMLVSWSNE